MEMALEGKQIGGGYAEVGVMAKKSSILEGMASDLERSLSKLSSIDYRVENVIASLEGTPTSDNAKGEESLPASKVDRINEGLSTLHRLIDSLGERVSYLETL